MTPDILRQTMEPFLNETFPYLRVKTRKHGLKDPLPMIWNLEGIGCTLTYYTWTSSISGGMCCFSIRPSNGDFLVGNGTFTWDDSSNHNEKEFLLWINEHIWLMTQHT